MDAKVQAVIRYIIDEIRVPDVTPKKLQKLLYYIQAWHLALTAEDKTTEEIQSALMIPCVFEAWVHGPVIPEVYKHYKEYGAGVIVESGFDLDYSSHLSADEISTIDEVIEVYGNFNGNQLEMLTHNELPWIEARKDLSPLDSCNEPISEETMFSYYGERLV